MITRDCVHLVTGSYFRSREQRWRSRHSIARDWKSYAARTLHRSMCYIVAELLAMGFSHCTDSDLARRFPLKEYWTVFDLLLPWPWPWPDDLHIRIWPVKNTLEIYSMRKYELPMSRLSKVIIWQTDRQTDRQNRPKLHITPFCRVVNNSLKGLGLARQAILTCPWSWFNLCPRGHTLTPFSSLKGPLSRWDQSLNNPFLTVPFQLILDLPGPLLNLGTSQYRACCGPSIPYDQASSTNY